MVFDFDGTITQKDTINNLADAAIKWHRSSEGIGKDPTETWHGILDGYVKDSASYVKSQPPEEERTILEQEISFLRGRVGVESASTKLVEHSGIFSGFVDGGQQRLRNAGKKDRESGRTVLRNGFTEFIDTLRNGLPASARCRWHVVSVNWSGDYISGVLEPWVLGDDPPTIVANEIVEHETEPHMVRIGCFSSPNHGISHLATSADKLGATRHLLREQGGSPTMTLYLGDSTTDLECLVEYGGIIMCDNGDGSLLRTLRRLAYVVPHVSKWRAEHLCWARNFREIMQSGYISKRVNGESLV